MKQGVSLRKVAMWKPDSLAIETVLSLLDALHNLFGEVYGVLHDGLSGHR